MSWRIVSLVLLSLGTIFFSVTYNRYEISAENLVRDPLFQDNLSNWQVQKQDPVSAHDGILKISNAVKNNNRSVSIAQTIVVPPEQHLLFLSCEARVLDVVPGDKRWEKARVVIFFLTAEGKPRHDIPRTLTVLKGTTPWAKFEQVFRIPEESAAVSVVIQLLNASGTLEVRSLALKSAIENPSYPKWQHALMLAWFIMGLWIIWPLVRAARRGAGRTGVLVTGCMILAGVLMPASVKFAVTPSWLLPETEASEPFNADLLPATIPFRFELLPTDLDIYKLAHFLLFAAIGNLLVAWRPYRIPIWRQAGIIALFALATESMQVLAAGRGGSLGDVVIDMAGACCGMLVAAAMRRRCDLKPDN
jgi:hypothetical protein